jgi:hypothetical protein
MRAFHRIVLSVSLLAFFALFASAAETVTLQIEEAETAGICGFRALWDTPVVTAADGVRKVTDKKITDRGGAAPWNPEAREEGELPGALAFDAIHRSLLVRFPGSARRIATKLREGYRIEKAEILLPFADTELWPWGSTNWAPPTGGYVYRANWGVDRIYRNCRPTWHAVGWALRRPWKADAEIGPTFNAYIKGAGYWTRFGAQDEQDDRMDQRFGPTPVHHQHLTGRMDVTASLTDERFGAGPAERLRRLADCGFLLRKWETYDHRYFTGAYEWATATGGRAIIIEPPVLVVTLEQAQKAPEIGDLPAPADVEKLAEELTDAPRGGRPTALMPGRDGLKELAREYATQRQPWMPEWQWKHVKQLLEIQYGEGVAEQPFWFQFVPGYIQGRYANRLEGPEDGWRFEGKDPEAIYKAWVDQLLGKQYRGWHGFEAARVLLPWFVYRGAMPEPAREWFTNYWTAWLMPDRPTAPAGKRKDPYYTEGPLVHPMADDPRVGGAKDGNPKPAEGNFDTYYEATGDWRGNKSFYRSGFNYTISTTNFNNTASMGALLGGAIIDSGRAIADGRHGQANFPLKLWTWYDGSTQEEIDDYYFAITVKAQKMVADFGPAQVDRLLGRSQLLKSMTILADAYHPGLRRYLAGSARTATHYRLGTQDGLYSVLHTLSEKGTLTDIGPDPDMPHDYKSFGRELPPAEAARQASRSPFAPQWYGHIIDHKPLPYQMTAGYEMWGSHTQRRMMRRTYLGENYGLYSINAQWGFIPITGHWRRRAEMPESSREIGTMFMRCGVNRTRLVPNAPGWIKTFGQQAALQHGNKLVVSASPSDLRNHHKVKSVQNSVALYNFQKPEPDWKMYIDGKPVRELPATAQAKQRITIHDGVSYIGVIPLPATDMGRDAQVVLHAGEIQEYYGKHKARAALVIDNYNYRRDRMLAKNTDWAALDQAYGGFVLEFGDQTEYGSFEAFQKHLEDAELTTSYSAGEKLHEVTYRSGDDRLDMGAYTTWNGKEKLDKLFAYQRINGRDAYLPDGVERVSPFSVQSKTGRLKLDGAELRCEEGRLAVLQREPRTGTVAACNPLAELTHFSARTPEGIEVTADGRMGLTFLTVKSGENTIELDYGFIEGQSETPSTARALVVFGMDDPPSVVRNGQQLQDELPEVTIGDRSAYVIPLGPGAAVNRLQSRYEAAVESLR